MAWIARSIANSLKLDDDDDDKDNTNTVKSNVAVTDSKPESDNHSPSPSTSSPTTATTPRGVKEDLTDLTKTLTRQFWGVASFLAPPPEATPSSPPPPPPQPSDHHTEHDKQSDLDPDPSNEDLIAGIRSDFAEIGGRFKSGISKLSSNKTVSEFTKMASNFLQFGSESDFGDMDLIGSAVGVTEEVAAFARDIAMHPETWLDFPIPDDDDEFECIFVKLN